MNGDKRPPVSLAVFASGTGTNAEQIIQHTADSMRSGVGNATVSLVVCNKPGAGVLNVADRYRIAQLVIEKDRFFNGDAYLPELKERGIEFIALAGFLWKVPIALIRAYPNRIINIHPALLPKYGGKGMYGARVHEAVIAAGEKESGITIHYVDEIYDHGEIIFQAHCAVDAGDDAQSLAAKIHRLEHRYYPEVIDGLLKNAK
jgi:phosphoribosylglycinamide formyltransferase-1